jgi:hypothetical protein
VSGDGKRARVAGYVCGEIDLRFFLVVRNVESERCTDSNKRPRDGSVVAKGARDKRMMMLYKERGRGRLSVLIETGEERVLSPSASHTHKSNKTEKMPSHLSHTQSQLSPHAASSFTCLGSRHLMFHNVIQLSLVRDVFVLALPLEQEIPHDRDGGETKNKSIIIIDQFNPPCDRMRKSESNLTTTIASEQRDSRHCRGSASVCVSFPSCFSLDASPRVSFLSHSTCSRWSRCVSSGPRPPRVWAVLRLAARWSIDHSYFGRFKC